MLTNTSDEPFVDSEAELGVLALQGDYAEHQHILTKLGIPSRLVRKREQLVGLKGLILPGGESSTMLKFMDEEDLFEPLRALPEQGCALYGTCAGAILLAKKVLSPAQESLGLMNITVERNGYGRQRDSHIAEGSCALLGSDPVPMVYIRAPIVRDVGPDVEVMMTHRDDPVLLREKNLLISTFHPELSEDGRIHEFFVRTIAHL